MIIELSEKEIQIILNGLLAQQVDYRNRIRQYERLLKQLPDDSSAQQLLKDTNLNLDNSLSVYNKLRRQTK